MKKNLKLRKNRLRIGCASAFWGDSTLATQQLLTVQDLDYLVFDYLAEVTLSIMAKARMKHPSQGYARDFVAELAPVLPELKRRKIKVISNAGGLNPQACAAALAECADKAGVNLKIAVVQGDDLLHQQALLSSCQITDMYSGRPFPESCTSINAYLGATGVAKALTSGADIVITGRIVDSALVLGPLIAEFDWCMTDYDRLAQGSLAGHVIECGVQCCGGNFTDWKNIEGFENMGFPVVDCYAGGDFVVSKPEATGGEVSVNSVAEQIVYEIGDPSHYQLPDVNCDFRYVELEAIAKNQIRVSGAKGSAPGPCYKIAATYADGYRAVATFLLSGRNAELKGRRVAQAIIKRVSSEFKARGWSEFSDQCIDILGAESTWGTLANRRVGESREVVVRIAVQHSMKEALALFAREIAPAATAMAPGFANLIGGIPAISPVVRLFSFLRDKNKIDTLVVIDNHTQKMTNLNITNEEESPGSIAPGCESLAALADTSGTLIKVPLYRLALARSGDKGNHANIGVIARNTDYLPYIARSLNPTSLAGFFSHLFSQQYQTNNQALINCWHLPGLGAINYLLENSLGGGGMASLRADPQGKAFAQQLLECPVEIPEDWVNKIQPQE